MNTSRRRRWPSATAMTVVLAATPSASAAWAGAQRPLRCPGVGAVLASIAMVRLVVRGLALLLVLLTFGFCAPDGLAAPPPASPEIASAGRALEGSACDIADPGAPALPGAKLHFAALPLDGALVLHPVLEPTAEVRSSPAPAPSRIALAVLAPRAPPRV